MAEKIKIEKRKCKDNEIELVIDLYEAYNFYACYDKCCDWVPKRTQHVGYMLDQMLHPMLRSFGLRFSNCHSLVNNTRLRETYSNNFIN